MRDRASNPYFRQHVYGEHRYPAQLVIQDVRTLHGSQFKNAAVIVASSPCQEYSYMAMPWTRAKAKAAAIRADTTGEALRKLNELFVQARRIQREACEAAGRHIPMVQENVKGAQPWVGSAQWHHGSFYLWGDVPALMPATQPRAKVPGMGAGWRPPGHPDHRPGLDFNTRAERQTKNEGGSWFNVAHNTESGKNRNPVHDGVKVAGFTGPAWFDETGRTSSKSPARKAASARIAKIPFPLAQHIARVYHPREVAVA